MKPASKKALTNKADRLFSAKVRGIGFCQLRALFPAIECNGNLQCCHIVSRRYKALRWEAVNALSGCAAHHLYATHHPLEWEAAINHSVLDLTALKRRALTETPADPAEVIRRLEGQPA